MWKGSVRLRDLATAAFVVASVHCVAFCSLSEIVDLVSDSRGRGRGSAQILPSSGHKCQLVQVLEI